MMGKGEYDVRLLALDIVLCSEFDIRSEDDPVAFLPPWVDPDYFES
jgi:hypothetical protein